MSAIRRAYKDWLAKLAQVDVPAGMECALTWVTVWGTERQILTDGGHGR